MANIELQNVIRIIEFIAESFFNIFLDALEDWICKFIPSCIQYKLSSVYLIPTKTV